MAWNDEPWARWNVAYTLREGRPVLTETELWYLVAHHPGAVEAAGDDAYLVHLDRLYRATRVPGRSYFACEPVP